MEEVKLTVAQVASEIGETVHIVRNWMKDLRAYIPSEKSANGYNLFTQDAINVLVKIKKMYREQNLSTKQIEAILSGADHPIVINQEQAAAIETTEIMKMLEDQKLFNAELLKRLDERDKQFEKFVQQRDQQITHVLRELQEQRSLMSGSEPWYKRWFSGKK